MSLLDAISQMAHLSARSFDSDVEEQPRTPAPAAPPAPPQAVMSEFERWNQVK